MQLTDAEDAAARHRRARGRGYDVVRVSARVKAGAGGGETMVNLT